MKTKDEIKTEAEKRFPVLSVEKDAPKNARRKQNAFIEGANWANPKEADVEKLREKFYEDCTVESSWGRRLLLEYENLFNLFEWIKANCLTHAGEMKKGEEKV